MKKWFAIICVLTVAVLFLTGGAVSSSEPAAADISNDITVTFDAGELGAVVGDNVLALTYGDVIGAPPQVDVPDGSQLVGWYLKGDPNMRIINLDKLTVYKSITLAAAYQ